MNTALILPPTASSFRDIAGLSLIERTVLAALRNGFDRVVVLPGGEGPRLRRLLAANARTRSVEVADAPPTELVREGDVTVIPGDCLVTAGTLSRLPEVRGDGEPVVVGDGSPAARLVRGRAASLARLLALGIGHGAADLGALGDTAVAPVDGVCVQVTDDASARVAETRLFAELRASTAASDGPLARLDRSASQWISRRLVYTPLRPNQITIIGTTVGLLGAWCIAQGRYGFEVLGTLLFVCAVVIDGCDGEVARLKFLDTPFGHHFDVFTDNVVHVAIFVALAFGQYRHHPDGHYTALLGVLLGGVACAAAAGYWCLLRIPHEPRVGPTRTMRGKMRDGLLRGLESLLNRDFAYLLFLLAVIDRLEWFVWGAAYGAWGFAAVLCWVYRWRDAD